MTWLKSFKKKTVMIAALAVLGSLAFVGVLIAYLTDNEFHVNKASIPDVKTTIVEEFDPPEEIEPGDQVAFLKKVQAKNTGGTDSYVRLAVEFSDSVMEGRSEISTDGGVTWFPAASLKDHLPSGWVYLNEAAMGGPYYYYTSPLPSERKNAGGTVIRDAGMTTPLFTHVRTTYPDNEEPRQYDIFVYAEAVQVVDNTGAEPSGSNAAISVWRSFIAGERPA